MCSIISFNFSTSGDKKWMKDYNQPLQIMPQTTKIPTDDIIATYPDCSKCKPRDSVIHTSYITRPFSDIYSNGNVNKFRYNIKQYIALCKRLSYKRLLIHLPATLKEMGYLGHGMTELINIFNNKDMITLNDGSHLILVLEIPAFKAGYKEVMTKYFEVIVSTFFDKFELHNVELCFDTAHIFANGMDCKDMIKLFDYIVAGKRCIDYAKIIHFNGNKNPIGKSDIHVQMFSDENKMTHRNKLIRYLQDKDKILITENTTTHSEYSKWKQYAEHYKVNIVDDNAHLSA